MNSIRMSFPGGKIKAFTLSYDDGVQQDIKLIALMRKRGVKGTFNLNSGCFAKEGTVYPAGQIHRRMTLNECKKLYAGGDIEVAVHGYTHPFFETLPAGKLISEIIRDRETLEAEFGGIVRGAAYPYGTFNDEVIRALADCGIVYSRTVISSHSFALPRNWLALEATCHHNDPQLNELADRFLAEDNPREPLLFYLWGHSYEFEAANNWKVIEGLLDKIGGRADVWYATNIEIYDYVEAYRALRFSADARRVFNPSSLPVWFRCENETHTVNPGEYYEF